MPDPRPPEIGEFTAFIIGMPGPDIDFGLCIDRKDDKALLRFQVWQRDGEWHEEWQSVTGATRLGCWATIRLSEIGNNLRAERARIFPGMRPIETPYDGLSGAWVA